MTSKVILSRQPLLSGTYEEQIANGAYIPQSALVQTSGKLTQSWVGVPIIINDQAVGVIHLGDYQKYAFGENQMRLLQTLCANMGVTLENARLFNETQRLLKETEQRAVELAAVNTVSTALASELNVSALIHLVGEQTRSIFNAYIAYVALLDESTNTINFPYTYGDEMPPIHYGEGLTSRIIQNNQPLLINQEMDRQALDVGPSVVGRKSLSYLGVPIAVSGKAVGVLSVQSTSKDGIFSEKEVRLLTTIASTALEIPGGLVDEARPG